MKTLSPAFAAHLASGATTLCWCWRIDTRDGASLGFTDHDVAVTFDGLSFEPSSGFTASALSTSLGLAVDDVEVEGVLSSGTLSEADLAGGVYDGADVTIYRVNWRAPEQRVVMRAGTVGEVERGGSAFRAEFRSVLHTLQQPVGRVFQSGCDAELGDTRCGVSLGNPAFFGAGQVLADLGDGWLSTSGLSGFAPGWFAGGTLTVTGGDNKGAVFRVRSHRVETGAETLGMWSTPPVPFRSGDPFTVRVGCDKTFSTCRERFSNGNRFRGFPHIPGTDFALGYPRAGSADNDGGSQHA